MLFLSLKIFQKETILETKRIQETCETISNVHLPVVMRFVN
jgi:hypothetical protein